MAADYVRMSQILDEVFEERAARIKITDAEREAAIERLRLGMAEVRAAAVRDKVMTALDRLPPDRRTGWLAGVKAALKLVVSVRRESYMVAEAARSLLAFDRDSWNLLPPADFAMRTQRSGGNELADEVPGARQLLSVGETGETERAVMVEDTGPRPRIVATIRNVPPGTPSPVLLVISMEEDAPNVVEVDPSVEPGTGADASGSVRLRYQAELPKGEYYVFFGNPRESAL